MVNSSCTATFTTEDRFVGMDRFVEDEMLGATSVILSYDLGNGLTVERGERRLAQWAPPVMRALPQQPLEAGPERLAGNPRKRTPGNHGSIWLLRTVWTKRARNRLKPDPVMRSSSATRSLSSRATWTASSRHSGAQKENYTDHRLELERDR